MFDSREAHQNFYVVKSGPYEKPLGLFSFVHEQIPCKNWPLPEKCRSVRIQAKGYFNEWGKYSWYFSRNAARLGAQKFAIRDTNQVIECSIRKKRAQQWARRVEAEMDSGLYVDRAEAERIMLREA